MFMLKVTSEAEEESRLSTSMLVHTEKHWPEELRGKGSEGSSGMYESAFSPFTSASNFGDEERVCSVT